MSIIRIGHAQLESKVGEFEANFEKLIANLERAVRDRVRIVSFPECFLTGYPDNEEAARAGAFAVDSPQVMRVLDATSRFDAVTIVGFNETRGQDLYNTSLVAYRGHLLGTYSKCTAYQRFHKQGREFPVFEHEGVKFGVVICSDGGYIEPTRLLALQGAKIVFAPHFNYLPPESLVAHYRRVRHDHIARAVENCIHFVRGNNVSHGRDAALSYEGVGYGDSYIVDPSGQFLASSRLHQEDFIFADVDTGVRDVMWAVGRSLWSARELGERLLEIARRDAAKG